MQDIGGAVAAGHRFGAEIAHRADQDAATVARWIADTASPHPIIGVRFRERLRTLEREAWKALVNATMLRADCSCERDPLTAMRKAQTDRAAALATLRRLGVDFTPNAPHGMWPKGDPK